MMEWPIEISEYRKASKGSPFFCRVVESISTDPFLCELRNEQGSFTQVVLLENGDIVIRHQGSTSAEMLMPNWPYHKEPCTAITISPGGCPGASTQ